LPIWQRRRRSKRWINNPYIYALSLAVYCTAWTYYGSIGVAATSGLNYLPIYIGPVMIIPAWIYINTRIVRISRVNKISSLADFISLDMETAEASAPSLPLYAFWRLFLISDFRSKPFLKLFIW
jgi:hypothetical protein